MAATAVTVYQDNIIGANNLMAVHSPLVFLIDVTYSGAAPELYCDITTDGLSPVSDDATFQCVYHSDQSPTVRRFMLRADTLIRGYMEDFEDFIQTAETVVEVLKVKQEFILVFYDEDELFSDTVSLVAFAATRQFGQSVAIEEIYDNEDVLYIAGQDKPVYVYFFNTVSDADVTITDGTATYHLAAGGETVIQDDDMTSWDGAGFETHPTNWTLDSNKTFGATWQILENPAGVGQLLMTGAVDQDYIALANGVNTWTKGQEVWFEMQYTTANTEIRIAAVEIALYFTLSGGTLSPAELYALSVPVPTAGPAFAGQVIKLTQISSHISIDGPRAAVIAIFSGSAADIDMSIDNIKLYAPVTVNYYRLKVDDLDTDTVYQLKEGSTVIASKTVRVKPFCTNYRYLKYLDRNGQYRFYPFNDRWETKDSAKKIGKINQLITNLLTDQGDSKAVGYTSERKITMVADDVIADELEILSDIYVSPRVYLEIGDGTTDIAKDWVRVDVTGSNAVSRIKKGTTTKVTITVTLPDRYNITML